MSNGNFTKVGISMLDMDEVKSYLEAVGFTTEDGVINDTKNVAGVEAAHIAKAYEDEEGNVTDRTTVRNAKNLDGHSADFFASAEDNRNMQQDSLKIKENYNKEIADLRDEVYQLREELAKEGYAQKYEPYAGYFDAFRSKHPVHQSAAVATCIEDSKPGTQSSTRNTFVIIDNDYENFAVGDHVLIYSVSTGKSKLVEIVEKKPDNQTIRFTPETDFDVLKDDLIYKSYGCIIDGQFVFGEMVDIKPGNQELIFGQTDDRYTTILKMQENNTGYATTFRVPQPYQKNYLAKMTIQVSKIGNPGKLRAYVIKAEDIDAWKNPQKAAEDGILIAQSKPLEVNASLGKHLAEFTFFDPNANTDVTRASSNVIVDSVTGMAKIDANPNNYPLLVNYDGEDNNGKIIDYCAIIEVMGDADEANYYNITMSGNVLHPNVESLNVLYEYKQQSSDSIQEALVTNDNININDMYYSVSLLKAVQTEFTPYTSGVYSAKFKTHSEELATSARLTMRIGREGIFNVCDDAGTPGYGDFRDGGTFTVKGETPDDVNGFYRSAGNTIIIGDQFRTVMEATGNSISVEKGLHIDSNADVYPLSYKVFIKAKKTMWDPETCTTKVLASGRYEMPLTDVHKDVFKNDDSISDRLTFKADFLDAEKKLQGFNDFEIEIFWEKTCKEISTKMIGKIFDVVVSLDKKVD